MEERKEGRRTRRFILFIKETKKEDTKDINIKVTAIQVYKFFKIIVFQQQKEQKNILDIEKSVCVL